MTNLADLLKDAKIFRLINCILRNFSHFFQVWHWDAENLTIFESAQYSNFMPFPAASFTCYKVKGEQRQKRKTRLTSNVPALHFELFSCLSAYFEVSWQKRLDGHKSWQTTTNLI